MQQYVGAHALLRLRLGEFTGQPAWNLRFSNDEYGKPTLDDRDGSVAFSLSHTRGMVAIAISAGGAVGVDVEATDRRISDEAAIVSAYFTPDEAAAFERAPEGPARKSLFVHMWTRKEAVLKAAGRGLGLPLSEFSVAGDNDWTEIPFIRAEAPFGFALASRSFGAFQVAIAVRLTGQARPSFLWREEAQDIFPRQGY